MSPRPGNLTRENITRHLALRQPAAMAWFSQMSCALNTRGFVLERTNPRTKKDETDDWRGSPIVGNMLSGLSALSLTNYEFLHAAT